MNDENLFHKLDYNRLADIAGTWVRRMPFLKEVRLYRGKPAPGDSGLSNPKYVLVLFCGSEFNEMQEEFKAIQNKYKAIREAADSLEFKDVQDELEKISKLKKDFLKNNLPYSGYLNWYDDGCNGKIASELLGAFKPEWIDKISERMKKGGRQFEGDEEWICLSMDVGDELKDIDAYEIDNGLEWSDVIDGRYWQLYPIHESKDQGQASGDRNPDTKSPGEENLYRIAGAIIPELNGFMQGAITEYGSEFYDQGSSERQQIIIDYYNDRRADFPNIEESMLKDIRLYVFDQAHAERFKAKLLAKILRKKGHQVKNYQAFWDKVKKKRD